MAIIKLKYNFCIIESITLPTPVFFLLIVCLEKMSKYAKLMVKPYACDILNQIYIYFKNFNKNFLKEISYRNVLENRLEDNKLISFIHL